MRQMAAAVIVLLALGACSGGEPSRKDITIAMARFMAAMDGGSEKAFEKAKAEIGEIKIVECKKADPGYRCSWTDAKGRDGGRARFVKDGEEWRLADMGG